jgi:phage terminase large subunit-like protein
VTARDPGDFRAVLARFAELGRRGHDPWPWLSTRLSEPLRRALFEAFDVWRAHGGQKEPEGPSTGSGEPTWRTWLLMAGRGFGKTRAGAEWVSARAREFPGCRIALVAASRDEAVKVMVEGPSGLLAVARADEEMVWWPTKGVVSFASGAEAFVYSAGAPESLRGPEHHFAWCDELAKWKQADAAWDNLNMGLRLGERPRALVTTTPRTVAILRRVKAAPGTVESFGRTAENAHLAAGVRDWLEAAYGGTRLGRQELDGMLFDEPAGALFPRALIEACRVAAFAMPLAGPPAVRVAGPYLKRGGEAGRPARLGGDWRRIVVGVDPPVSADGDGCGIVVCGLGQDARLYVLADASVSGLSPEGWARAVARAAAAWGADRVVAEKNQGGDMVASVLRAVDPSTGSGQGLLPVKLVSASRGKAARAEPVAARFEAGGALFAGQFPALEDELAGLVLGGGYEGPGRSPDRADACVWALTELLATPGQPGIRAL